MDSFDLMLMTDAQLVSLIHEAQAIISDRESARYREFLDALARAEQRQRRTKGQYDPTAHQGTDAMQGGADG